MGATMPHSEGTKTPPNGTGGTHQLPNVILITVDAFNYDLFMANLDSLPNLKRLRAESVSFDNAFSIGPSTFFAFPGIIASVYPHSFGIGIDNHVRSIDEVLKECGYRTAQINECNALLTPFYGYGRGTDYQQHFLNLSHVDADRKLVGTFMRRTGGADATRAQRQEYLMRRLYRKVDRTWIGKFGRDLSHLGKFLRLYLTSNTESFKERSELHRRFREELLEFISDRFQRPQFLFIHSIANHLPYFPPEDSNRFDEREIDYLNYRGLSGFVNRGVCTRLKDLYVESLRSTDRLIGEVLEALRTKSLLERSIVVLTADHGEEFMEEGYFGHTDESSSDRLLHVPLIFYCPSLFKPKTVAVPVSTIDIVPTICDLVGSPTPDTCRGVSLRPIAQAASERPELDQAFWERPVFSEAWDTAGLLDRSPGYNSGRQIFTVRKGQHRLKAIRHSKKGQVIGEELELANWTTGERLDLSDNARTVQELRQLLDEHIVVEGAFARTMHARAEQQRMRKVARAIRPGS